MQLIIIIIKTIQHIDKLLADKTDIISPMSVDLHISSVHFPRSKQSILITYFAKKFPADVFEDDEVDNDNIPDNENAEVQV